MDGLHVVVIGAGVFGAASALALAERGHRVTLLDPGPIPHPLAESTDISKIVRLDYGADEEYTALMERALAGFRAWNARFSAQLFHETGLTFLCRAPMAPGGFEYESHALLSRRGHRLERLDAAEIRRRFPAWQGPWVDGYFNPQGGWAESGKVVAALVREAERAGVLLREGSRVVRIEEQAGKVTGVVLETGEIVKAERVVVAAGAWTPDLLPHLAASFRAVGQPVFHLQPADPEPFRAPVFPVFGADIARTGYYGFPVNAQGIVKIANHGPGRPMHPSSDARQVTAAEERALREFLKENFPLLATAPLVATRICVYGDTLDAHFWIAPDPALEGLVVAAGGSGHGFKFAPVLGELVVAALEGAENPFLAKFRHRPEMQAMRGEEAARYQG